MLIAICTQQRSNVDQKIHVLRPVNEKKILAFRQKQQYWDEKRIIYRFESRS